MKKILSTFIGAFFAITLLTTFNSCAPTAPPETTTPITLIAVPGTLALTRTATSQNTALGLSCGCAFGLGVTAYGGDTSLIHFTVWEAPDSSVHRVTAFVSSLPMGPGKDSAWIGLRTPNDSVSPSRPGTPIYDTVRVQVTY